MNSRSLRRLAGDHAALHNSPLPPNYFFGPSASNDSDLTSLDILLAGPTSTPYETGVFKLHLVIPTTYPNEPPKAFFRTKIFHPNVDDNTGAVCVETLKRDWDSKLSLRDVLVTISCLLVQPNASSALNADAGMLLEQGEDGWEAFAKRAKLMTRLHAGVPRDLKETVKAAQRRGEEREEIERKDSGVEVSASEPATGKRRRRGTPLPRDMAMETPVEVNRGRADTPPPPPATRAPAASRPFVLQSTHDDVFGNIRLPAPSAAYGTPDVDTDSELLPADQENDSCLSPVIAHPPTFPSPKRQAPPVPLDEASVSEEESFHEEYPPSPKKSPQKQQLRNPSIEYPPSPRKSPQKRFDLTAAPPQIKPGSSRAEASRNANDRRRFFTPVLQNQPRQQTPQINQTLDSSFLNANVSFDLGMETEPDTEVEVSFEMPKRRPAAPRRLAAAARTAQRATRRSTRPLDDPFNMPAPIPRLSRSRKPTPLASTPQRPLSPVTTPESLQLQPQTRSPKKKSVLQPQEAKQDKIRKSPSQVRNERLEKRLWSLCGGDVEKWNRGDFGGFFELKAARW